MIIQTRQIRKRDAFVRAFQDMPLKEQFNDHLSLPISRRRRRAMAWAKARRVAKA